MITVFVEDDGCHDICRPSLPEGALAHRLRTDFISPAAR
jgi:hypothetical protein